MLEMRMGLFVALLSLVINGAAASGCGAKRGGGTQSVNRPENRSENRDVAPAPTPVRSVEGDVSGNIKVLAEGGYSSVADPFLAVARDGVTYAALREMARGLPEMNDDSFKTAAVVAAFLGQRRTGGYSVAITEGADGVVHVTQNSPPRGALTAQVLTAPFKIVSVPAGTDAPLTIDLDGPWRSSTRPYRVTTGEFTMSGGIAGGAEKFQLRGDILIMRQGKLATLIFDLKSEGGARSRALKGLATGVVQTDGHITIANLDAGTLVDHPHSALRASGTFTAGEDKVSLAFEPLPSHVSDGYEGRGHLDAAATAPPPPKHKPLEDEPVY